MILSLVNDEPDAVTATGARYLHKSIADVTTTHLSFPGGERAHIFVSWLHPFKEQKLVVVGDRGMAVFDDGQPWDSKLAVYRHRIDWRDGMPAPVKADAEPVALESAEPLSLECQHFLDCVATGSTPRTDGAEGVRVLRVLTQAGADLARDESLGRPVDTDRAASAHDGAFVHESAFIDDDCGLGAGTRVWHFSHLLAHTIVGADCTIGQNVMIGPNVQVGDRCKIQNNVSLFEGVVLDDGVFCGPSCVFTNVLTPRAEVERKDEFLPTHVGRGASIGANATIVCGNAIGEYAMVGAGAVVTAEVPAHALVVGVPARRIGWVSHDGEVLGPDLVCPRSGRRYRATGDTLEEISA
jgi:acetyltransferase-like isoleucine patch superfamily enzyme